MCGLYGYSGKKPADAASIIMLALENSPRGTDSIGLAGKKKLIKSIKTPRSAILSDDFDIHSILGKTVVGHNRAATTGAVNERNAHPFPVGGAMCSHNGFVLNGKSLAKKYNANDELDSRNIYHIMVDNGFETLADIEGPMALAFSIGDSLYLFRRESKPLHIGFKNDGMYYSSLPEPLQLIGIKDDDIYIIGANFMYEYKEGEKMGKFPIPSPKLIWDITKSEPRLSTWKDNLTEECKKMVFDATDGEHENVRSWQEIAAERERKKQELWDKHYKKKGKIGFRQGYEDAANSTEQTNTSLEIPFYDDNQVKVRSSLLTETMAPATSSDTGSKIFDMNCDFSIFTNTSQVVEVPGYKLHATVDKKPLAKTSDNTPSLVVVKVLKEKSEDNSRELSVYPHKDIMVQLAGLEDAFVTNEEGIATIPIPVGLAESERRMYLWGAYNMDSEPFYTKHITIPNSAIVEVIVIIPFRFDTENSEDGDNQDWKTIYGTEKETQTTHSSSGSTSNGAIALISQRTDSTSKSSIFIGEGGQGGGEFLDDLERGREAHQEDIPEERENGCCKEDVGCGVSRLSLICDELHKIMETVEDGLDKGVEDMDEDSLGMLKLYMFNLESLHDDLTVELSDQDQRGNVSNSIRKRVNDLSLGTHSILNRGRKVLHNANW